MATYAHADVRRRCRRTKCSPSCATRVDARERAGIARERIVVDPGIGFAKRGEHSLRRARPTLPRLVALGLSGARRRVAQAVHRRDHRRARSPAERVCGNGRRERRGARARRADLPRARRAADAPGARRRVGDSCSAGRHERSSNSSDLLHPGWRDVARDRGRQLRDLSRAAADPPHARACRCWSGIVVLAVAYGVAYAAAARR